VVQAEEGVAEARHETMVPAVLTHVGGCGQADAEQQERGEAVQFHAGSLRVVCV
jgi:hypothetical protein